MSLNINKPGTVLICALGNPGEKYAKTRHNIGFMFADKVSASYRFSPFQYCKKMKGFISVGNVCSVPVIILKPDTFMNRSGVAVSAAVNAFGVKNEDIIVVHDDVDIKFGSHRIKTKGGNGGHNGLRSIEGEIGTDQFVRIRLGIGKPVSNIDLADFVLADFLDEEMNLINNSISSVWKKIVCKIITEGVAEAMNTFNRRSG